MKKKLLYLLILLTLLFSYNYSNAQVIYTYLRPKWTIGFGTAWNLATNDAYGRANYASIEQVIRDNYGMRWGYGGYVFVKFSPGKLKNNRIFLGFDYKGMKNKDFSDENSIKYDIMTIDAGYEYLFYGTYGFRSYYGAGLTGNIISGEFVPKNSALLNTRTFESSFRMGMELKAGLEFVLKNRKRNLGIHVGARYNLMNLFNDGNQSPLPVKRKEENLNDGDATGGPGFNRYIGIVSIDVGLNIYPDVKRTRRK